jgi:hypothetical protein
MHIPVDDPKFVAATQADGWDIRLTCQPPNSPNLNILDLGFFCGAPINLSQAISRYFVQCCNDFGAD